MLIVHNNVICPHLFVGRNKRHNDVFFYLPTSVRWVKEKFSRQSVTTVHALRRNFGLVRPCEAVPHLFIGLRSVWRISLPESVLWVSPRSWFPTFLRRERPAPPATWSFVDSQCGRHVPQAGAACPPCLGRGPRVSFRDFLVPVVRLAHVVGLGTVLVHDAFPWNWQSPQCQPCSADCARGHVTCRGTY